MAILLGPTVMYYMLHGNHVEMNIVDAKQPSADEIELTVDGDPHHVLHPTSITPNTDVPMAIVFVMEGTEQWIGNDMIETDPNNQWPGELRNIEAAFDRLDLAQRVPPGSEVGIVTYATGTKVRLPLSPVAQLHGSSFGTQQDYRGAKGNNLMKGVEAGLIEVSRASAQNRLVIAIADDTDDDMAAAKPKLAELRRRAATMNTAIEGIGYRVPDLGGEYVVIGTGLTVNSAEGLQVALADLVATHRHSFRATFDVQRLPVWDGKPHNVSLHVDGVDTPPTPMIVGVHPIPAWWTMRWFKIALAGMCLAPFVVLGVRRVRASA